MIMDDDRIKEIIREELDKLLVERLSVSQEVVDATDLLMKEAINTVNAQEPFKCELNRTGWYDENQEWHDGVTLTYVFIPSERIQQLVGKIARVEMKIHYFRDAKSYQKQYQLVKMGARYSPSLQVIQIWFPVVGRRIVMDHCKNVLMHELEHKFQSMKAGGSITNDVYQKATELTSSGNEVQKAIAWLLYFFHPRELDAKLHEMYYYLCSMKTLCGYEDMVKLRPYQEMEYCLENYLKPLLQMDQKEIANSLRDDFQLDKSPKWLFDYVERQRQYFVMKMRKIYMRALEVAEI